MQAEANMHSASAQVGVAIANRLPNIHFVSNAGSTALADWSIVLAGTEFWTISSNVRADFRWRHIAASRARCPCRSGCRDAQYRSTVLTAFQNVADTLTALQQDADGLKAAAKADTAAKTTLALTQRQLQDGYTNTLGLLSAEQAYQQAEISLSQAEANRYADTAALFQALGGGWWHRTDLNGKKKMAELRKIALAFATTLLFAGCSPKSDNQQAPSNGTTVKLTAEQRLRIQLYTVAEGAYRKSVNTTGVVDFDNDQATTVLAPIQARCLASSSSPAMW